MGCCDDLARALMPGPGTSVLPQLPSISWSQEPPASLAKKCSVSLATWHPPLLPKSALELHTGTVERPPKTLSMGWGSWRPSHMVVTSDGRVHCFGSKEAA